MVIKNNTLRICLAASAGGHLSQLTRLSDSWTGQDTFYVVTKEVVRQELQKTSRVYVIEECNRQHPLRVIQVFYRCLKIIFRERPDVAISTGAAPGFLLCLAAKMFGARIVWVDSIANIEVLSLSGRLVRSFADLFLTQWLELANHYNNVEYVGTIV
ncbi:MAG: hypothetical protein AMJ43_07410 [Coxiella sp. DG_40]|nr:MAG: hypothetical protein AMJ43_07410 [Coxiella sp. DG_40]